MTSNVFVALLEVAPAEPGALGEHVVGGFVRAYVRAESAAAARRSIADALADAGVGVVAVEWCFREDEVDWDDPENVEGRDLVARAAASGQAVLGEFHVWGPDDMPSYAQLVIAPPDGCTGAGLRDLVAFVAAHSGARFASVSDVDLSGPAREALGIGVRESRVHGLSELLRLLGEAEQVIWANVFLSESAEQAESITADEDYVDALLKSVAAVRAIDAGAFYVDGAVELARAARAKFGGELDVRPADQLDFPE